MFVQNRRDLIYFAYPKCASEWMREKLNLEWKNIYDENDWSLCDLTYCHVQPMRFLNEHGIDPSKATMITIFRNTYDRLYSCYVYGKTKELDYVKDMTFDQFVRWIYDNRHNLLRLPFCWMFIRVDQYFGELIDKIHFFHMEDLPELTRFLKENYDISIDSSEKVNATKHGSYIGCYDAEMIEMVNEVYRYEITRFGYRF